MANPEIQMFCEPIFSFSVFFPWCTEASKALTWVMWKRTMVVWISTYWFMCNMWLSLLSLAWFRVQITVCSAERGSHISIFHSQLHHHAYEEQQTSRKQCECSPPVYITAWLLTPHISSVLVASVPYSIHYTCALCAEKGDWNS